MIRINDENLTVSSTTCEPVNVERPPVTAQYMLAEPAVLAGRCWRLQISKNYTVVKGTGVYDYKLTVDIMIIF